MATPVKTVRRWKLTSGPFKLFRDHSNTFRLFKVNSEIKLERMRVDYVLAQMNTRFFCRACSLLLEVQIWSFHIIVCKVFVFVTFQLSSPLKFRKLHYFLHGESRLTRRMTLKVAPCKVIQISLGFWIPRLGFRILCHWKFDSLSRIPDYKGPGFRIPQAQIFSYFGIRIPLYMRRLEVKL